MTSWLRELLCRAVKAWITDKLPEICTKHVQSCISPVKFLDFTDIKALFFSGVH